MNKKHKLLPVVIFSAAAAVLLTWIFFNDPRQSNWTIKCAFYQLSGLHCPGCGATRALYELLHGNIIASLRNNLLIFPLLFTAIILLRHPEWALKRSVAYTTAAVIILFMILRNLPFYPLVLLAPPV